MTFLRNIEERCRLLETLPFSSPLLESDKGRGISKLTYGNYLIFYRAENDQVTILHVIHGARDYENILRFLR